MSLTIYHYPRCTKSRNALNLLKEKQNEGGKECYKIEEVRYQEQPPSVETLKELVCFLGWDKIDKNESPWNKLLRPDSKSGANSWEGTYELIQKSPEKLERPFVIDWDHKAAALGRPDLSDVEKLIDSRISALKAK